MTPEEKNTLISDVSEIKTALLGQPEFQQEGIVHQVKKNTTARKNIYKGVGFFTGLYAAWEVAKRWLLE